MSRRKVTTILILAIIGVIALCVAVFFLLSRLESDSDKAPENAGQALSRTSVSTERFTADGEPTANLYYKGQAYRYNEDLRTLLVIGVDDNGVEESKSYRNGGQSDFLTVAVFDDANKTLKLIQLNRDTMAEIPVLDSFGQYVGVSIWQLAFAHTYGKGLEDSCEYTRYAVSRLLYSAEIDNYVAVTMDSIAVLNDLVGGVTVTIEDDFSGEDETLVKGESVTLMGQHAENYVRARMGMVDDDTNIARMRRQRTYMLALFSQLQEAVAADSGFALDAYNAVADSLVTDCTLDQLTGYAEQLSDYTLEDIVTPEGELTLGEEYYEFYPDEDALQQLVLDIFYLPVDENA